MGGRGASFGAPSAKLREALKTAEDKIRNRKTEKACVVDGNGNAVFEKTNGKKDYVSFNATEVAMMREAVMTHNHPSGSTFSPEDLDLAFTSTLREIRACHANGYYSLRRMFDVGNTIPQNYFDFSKDYDIAVQQYMKNTVDGIWAQSNQTQSDADRCNKMVDDYRDDWLRNNAASYGWKYTTGGK